MPPRTLAMAELLLSGCTTTTDHHYVFPPGLGVRDRHRDCRGATAGHAHRGDARFDEPIAARRWAAAGQRGAGRGHHPCRQRAPDRAPPRPVARRDGADRAGALLAVQRDDVADARHRGAGGADRRAAAHAPGGDRGREPLLPGRRSAAGRSIIWRSAAGCTTRSGWRTAFISTTKRLAAWPAPGSP